jgi:hypothetical protein
MAQITLNSSGVASNGTLALQSNGTTPAVTINTSQNVGIGTVSPATRLSVDAARSDTVGSGWLTVTEAAITGGKWGQRVVAANNSYCFDYYNGTSWNELVTIASAGNVGIGASSPTYKLDVAGFSRGAIVHRVGSYSTGATTPSVSGVTVLYITNSSPTTITNFTDGVDGQIIYLYFSDSNTTINRSNAYLAGGANFVSTFGDMLVLFKTGVNWYEISRSANS